jgi:hypothetical protein
VIPLFAWFLAPACWAKKPVPVPAPDPAELAKAAEAVACAPDVPENYQIHTGFASGEETAAITAAVEDARMRTLLSVCSGKSPTRCEVLVRHVEAWKVPYWNPVTGRACAHAGVRRDYLDDDKGDQQRLASELSRLGADVAAKVGSAALWIEPPTFAQSGCHAGPVGSSMVAELKSALAAAGSVRLAAQAETATILRLTLDTRGTEVVVSGVLQEPGKSTLVPLVGFTVAEDLFEIGSNGGDCRFDQELGLVAGQRQGSDGRTVRVKLPGDGAYCEGDRIEPVLLVDRPSRVKVFSVARDGRAFVVWPPPGQEGKVEATASLGELELVRTADLGDEKLVAIAVPVGGSFGPSQTWTAFCETPGPVTAASWAKSAAAGAATFVVQPSNAPACARRNVARRPLAQVPAAPVCR